jgi:hypothetical protein
MTLTEVKTAPTVTLDALDRPDPNMLDSNVFGH